MSDHSSPGNAELDKVQIAFGVATTQTEVDPERRWQAIKLVSEFLGRLRLNAPAQGGSACGEDAIMEAAESAAVGAQIVRSYGDILIYYSGFNLSRFVRYLALSTQRPGHVDGAGSTPASAPKDQGLSECGSSTLPPAPALSSTPDKPSQAACSCGVMCQDLGKEAGCRYMQPSRQQLRKLVDIVYQHAADSVPMTDTADKLIDEVFGPAFSSTECK